MLIDLIPKWEWDCWLNSTMERQGSEQEIGEAIVKLMAGYNFTYCCLSRLQTGSGQAPGLLLSLQKELFYSSKAAISILLTHKAIAYKFFKRFFLEITVILCIINALLHQVAARPKQKLR